MIDMVYMIQACTTITRYVRVGLSGGFEYTLTGLNLNSYEA